MLKLQHAWLVLPVLVSCGREPAPAVPPVPTRETIAAPADVVAPASSSDAATTNRAKPDCAEVIHFHQPSERAEELERLVLRRDAYGRLTVELHGRFPDAVSPRLTVTGATPCAVDPAGFDVFASAGELAAFDRCDGAAGGTYTVALTLTSPPEPRLSLEQELELTACTPALGNDVRPEAVARVRERLRTSLASAPVGDRKLSVRVDVGGARPEQWCLAAGRSSLTCDAPTADAVLRISANDLVALHEGKVEVAQLYVTGGLQLYGSDGAMGLLGSLLHPE